MLKSIISRVQRCRWQYGSLYSFSGCCPRSLRKLELTAVQSHPRSSIMVSIESLYATSY